jgi:hypothetical protein
MSNSHVHPVMLQALAPFVPPAKVKRQPATRQAVQHIIDMMASIYCDGEDLATLLDGIEGMAAGSAYDEYGTVNFSDLAEQVRDEIAAFEEPQMCSACSGTGEGQYDGTNCYSCNGKGVHPSPKDLMERDRHEP